MRLCGVGSMRRHSDTLQTLFLCAVLLLGCKNREYPEGFSKAFVDEAIKMTEAIVPYCKDMLAKPGCPYKDPDDESDEYRSPSPAGSLPIFAHPFRESELALQYSVRCQTRDDHPRYRDTCQIRWMQRAIGSPPDECEQLSGIRGWDNLHKGDSGEALDGSINPKCPLPQYRLTVLRSASDKTEAMFYGVFLKQGTKPPWTKQKK
jgi:hypothetical protein